MVRLSASPNIKNSKPSTTLSDLSLSLGLWLLGWFCCWFLVGNLGWKWRGAWTGRYRQRLPELTPEELSKKVPFSFPQVGCLSFRFHLIHCRYMIKSFIVPRSYRIYIGTIASFLSWSLFNILLLRKKRKVCHRN